MCMHKYIEVLAYSQVCGNYKDKHRSIDTNMHSTCVYIIFLYTLTLAHTCIDYIIVCKIYIFLIFLCRCF